ncbi:hypothetical protein J2741_000230 [Methanolinea mesophila]|uniref:M23 family metallopeptidase n=1 Tax=Methanolinea mesophila TaxID=547055 RepID=UPI001AE91ABD|nr:M23 family metallopeptidase [Methanolinea mesophila]MBP1927683.1 hypothetical protein [Methanolinea mesophila]
MSPPHSFLLIVIAVALVLAAGCTQPAVPPTTAEMPAVTITVPFPPVPVASNDGVNIAYELVLKPATGTTPVPEKVEVIDPATGNVIYTLEGELLADLYHPASVPPPTQAEIMEGTGKLSVPRVSIWFRVAPDAVPDRLTHRLTLNRTADGQSPETVTGGDIVVRKDLSPVVIGSPMRGPGWLAMETTSPETHHFKGQITMNGTTRVPQRYAQDWVYLDPETGKVAPGNVSLALEYFGFGKEIYAVANGTVVDAVDGLPDSPAIYSPLGVTIPTIAGNYVIIDLGNDKYACYAHMVNGSVLVKKGDIVREGQVIGLLGNSGNSDIPHLHFQVVTGTPSFLGAEGYPHVYRSFDATGGINMTRGEERMSEPGYSVLQLWSEFDSFVTYLEHPVLQENRLPDNNMIVRFP